METSVDRAPMLTTPYLLLITVFAVATWLTMCVFINPPFFVSGRYDKSLVDTRVTDVYALVLVLWFILVGAFIWLRGRQYPKIAQKLADVTMIGLPIGILLLAFVFFLKAWQTSDAVVQHFWQGQAVGSIGIG